MLHLDPRQSVITTADELRARMVGLDNERHQDVYSGQAEVGDQIVKETTAHLTQGLAEQGHDVIYDEAREGA